MPLDLNLVSSCMASTYAGEVARENFRKIKTVVDALSESAVSKTVAVTHVYANGSTGSDSNSGLSAAAPKKTRQAVFDLLPFLIANSCVVHLAGVFNEDDTVYVEASVAADAVLVVDGGTDTTVVFDNGGAPFVADIGAINALGLASLAMTPDEYAGYWLKPSSGSASGQQRTIQKHDATTFTPIRDFSVDPGAAGFTVVRPTTELTGSGKLVFKNAGGGIIRVQNLFCTGSACVFAKDGRGDVFFSHMVITSTGGDALTTLSSGGINCSCVVGFVPDRTNTTTLEQDSAATDSSCGVTDFGVGSGSCFLGVESAFFMGSYSPLVVHFWHSCPIVMYGSRAGIMSVFSATGSTYTFMEGGGVASWGGWAPTRLGGLPWGNMAGLLCVNSGLMVAGPVDFTNPNDIGIEVFGNSFLMIVAGDTAADVPTGVAAKIGVYAHSGAQIHIDPAAFAAVPTITGTTVGDISTDGATLKSTWAAVYGGTPARDADEMVQVKAYSPFVRAFGL